MPIAIMSAAFSSEAFPPTEAQFSKRNLFRYIAILTIAAIGSFAAQDTDHPVTAGLIFVVAIMINGAMGGLAAGLSSGLIAAFIYNFFIRFPVFTFGFSTIDDYVPLIAFNIAAAVTGGLSGKLKDRAQSAEQARNQLDALLAFSNRLQRAVHLEEVANALGEVVSGEMARRIILPYLEENFPMRRESAWRTAVASRFSAAAAQAGRTEPRFDAHNINLPSFAGLLWMAIERCDLLEQHTEAEAVRRSEELKTILLSSLSHDLRTPIAAIAASAGSLISYGTILDNDTQQDMLRTIQDQCVRLDRFTGNLLSLGQLQGGVSASQMELVDLTDSLGSAIQAVRAMFPERHIEKQIRNTAIVQANPVMLEQVLLNLLENAVRYSPDDTDVIVRIETLFDTVKLWVIDHGKGISPDMLNRVFDPFVREKQAAHPSGSGLGLSIARGFVKEFGGNIAAISPIYASGGTQMIVTLPLAPTEHSEVIHA